MRYKASISYDGSKFYFIYYTIIVFSFTTSKGFIWVETQ